MNKQDVVTKIAKHTGIAKTTAAAAIDSLIDGITRSLKKGDSVITQGGIIGKIAELTDTEVKIEVSQGVKMRVLKSAIQNVVPAADGSRTEDKKEEK